jgi:hypothetical protein
MKNRKFFVVLFALAFFTQLLAQKNKVQAAWRSLSDYEETLKENRPEISYLNKAQEAIDGALASDDTKKQAKTHAYKLRISYALFQYYLNQEIKKLEATVGDKNERLMQAYGNVSLNEFESAVNELNTIRDLDPKYLEALSDAIQKGSTSLEDEDIKLAGVLQQLKVETANIASGKYKAKKYEEAADYFFRTGVVNTVLYRSKDTASFYNACVAAARTKNVDKIIEYNRKMIEAKISSAYNYESIYNAYLAKKDSAQAIEALKKGRVAFPQDVALLTAETNLFLGQGRHQEALSNLKQAVEKDPKNALYYFIMGELYDNLANPKDKNTGKDVDKPSNFDELFGKAEQSYQKAIDLKPTNKEYLYNSNYNLGAMYNNYGGYLANKGLNKITDLSKNQRDNEAKAQVYYRKAIPYLETALSIRAEDKLTMTALRKLYMLTGDEVKAKQMNERLK